MSLLSSSGNNKISNMLMGYRASTSLVGRPIPILYGKQRLAGNVIWTGGWAANPHGSAKSNKGKSGQYDYITNVIIALCSGPIQGIYSIWINQDKYNLAPSTETYAVPGGGGTYNALYGGTGHPYWWVVNVGVSRKDSLSATATDYGSSGSVTLPPQDVQTPMLLVPGTPGLGEYRLDNDTSGIAHYTFSAADGGKVMTITYMYQLDNYSTRGSPMTHLNLVLFPGYHGQAPWNYLLSNPLFKTQGLGYSETAYLGSGQFDLGSSGVVPNLNFEVQGRNGWGGSIVDANPADILLDMLTNPLDGILGWATSIGSSSSYGPVLISGKATVSGLDITATTGVFSLLAAGAQIVLGGISVTLVTIPTSTTATVAHSPGDGVEVDWSATATQTYSQITGSSLWLPANSAVFGLGKVGEVFTYCAANGIFLSPLLEQQQEARSIINDILLAANSDAFWSEGIVKFRSYGDTTAIGHGYTYTPHTQPVYDIDDSDLICDPGQEPVQVGRSDVRDIKNEVNVEWMNRDSDYVANTYPAQNFALIQRFGRRPDSTRTFHSICTQTVAASVAHTILQRLNYIEGANQYTITLGPHFCLLEPMDIITLTEEYLGMFQRPLRIVSIEEDEKLLLKMTLEVFPWSVSAPTAYPTQGHGPTPTGYYAVPGFVSLPMFVSLPKEKVQGNQYAVGIALSGSINWGGAAIYLSTDGGNSYDFLGIQSGRATMGNLTVPLPVGIDPDVVNTLSVSLTDSYGVLASFTQGTPPTTEADALVSLIVVDEELLAYETASFVSQYFYDLTYLRRGAYDSDIVAHQAGGQFCMVNGSLFQWDYPASVIGTTVYFKFCSFNQAGLRQQNIADVTPYPYFVKGPKPPYPLNAGWEPAVAGDALATLPDGVFNRNNFGIFQQYKPDANGTLQAWVPLLANLPISVFSKTLASPIITNLTAVAGGTLAGNKTYLFQLFAFDNITGGRFSPPGNVYSLHVPAGTNYKINFTVAWPEGSFGGDLFVAVGNTHNGIQYEQALDVGTSTSGTGNYTLSTVSGKDRGVPDADFYQPIYQVRTNINAGVLGVVATISANKLTFAGIGGATNFWKDRIISLLALPKTAAQDSTHTIPIANFKVTGSSGDDLTVTPNPQALGIPSGSVFVVRTKPTSCSATGFTDAAFQNPLANSNRGLTNSLVGELAFIMAGKGAQQPFQTITANTLIGVTVAPGWQIPPDETSIILFLSHAVDRTLGGQNSFDSYASATQLAPVPVQNETGYTAFLEILTADSLGVTAPEEFARFREVYLWGAQGTRTISALDILSGTNVQLPTDGLVMCNTSGVTPPVATTLVGNINDTVTAIEIALGTAVVNETFIEIDRGAGVAERMLVVAGGGTVNLTVIRSKTPFAHIDGATVSLPGELPFTLLSISNIPNQPLVIHKITTDINYVGIYTASGDVFPGGGNRQILPDTSPELGTFNVLAPGN